MRRHNRFSLVECREILQSFESIGNMKLAVTGFVSEQAGSVASANALLLRELLLRGHEIHFYSKPSFVDPRPAVGERPGFRFFDVTNVGPDQFRRRVEHVPFVGFLAGRFDASDLQPDAAQGDHPEFMPSRNTICVSGWGTMPGGERPAFRRYASSKEHPGTDARSVLRQSSEVKRLAGRATALKWQILARIRLSGVGLPPFKNVDHFIVGSSQSKRTLHSIYGIPDQRISTLPYPIDLELFNSKGAMAEWILPRREVADQMAIQRPGAEDLLAGANRSAQAVGPFS